jgi:hypothetical protein
MLLETQKQKGNREVRENTAFPVLNLRIGPSDLILGKAEREKCEFKRLIIPCSVMCH